jgi:lipoprotein-anchoring transpeptidase ErfK/SrfK
MTIFQLRAIAIAPALFLGLALVHPPLFGTSEAKAQSWWNASSASQYRSRARASRVRPPHRSTTRRAAAIRKPSAEEVQASKARASGPLLAVVSLGSQRMTVYDGSGPIIRSPVSTGKVGHRTPTGVFSVLQKNRHHVSNIYSGAPMPYMQRLTWSGIALHAGVLPGYPASAGCIRMPYPVAARLFAMSRMGMRVVVAPDEPTLSEFAHGALPEPLMVAAPVAGEGHQPSRQAGDAARLVRVASVDGADAAEQVAMRFLNPMEKAALDRSQARSRLAAAVEANKDLLAAALRASAEAKVAASRLRDAMAASEQVRARLSAATDDDARAAIGAELAGSERALAEAISHEAERNRAAYEAARASREAEDAVPEAQAAVRAAERATDPIAVFVSRREGKVMVRQGMVPLFEAPVTFKDPGKPLGTHVYQAMAADGATGRLTWKVLTVPESAGPGEAFELQRGPVRRGERAAPQVAGPPSDASEALERVEMSEDVRRRIAERLWTNGSIVISDHGVGNETGKGTDFIVLTR